MIGIDLGTTNSAVAWAEPRGPVRIYEIPQLVAAGETARRPTLPSFVYLVDAAQRAGGAVRLPWDPSPESVAGVYAREEGALVPARQISSAKSWLSNPRVDRTAPLLPWGGEGVPRLSPVEASTRILAHVRDAWNHDHAGQDEALRLERRPVVLTVPASFDEEARELTVQAGRDAGFSNLTLLEEPLAALYAWIAVHRRALAARLGTGALILVCDVGGGTTDFSLIRAYIDEGDLAFERVAIGEHLLLGGDNLDLALAVLAEEKIGDASKLSLAQRLALRRKCSAAKEQLLSNPALDHVRITILGTGRGVVGGGLSVELTQGEVVRTLTSGFLPITPPDDLPARDRRVGLRELGLPYETEPAITRHLAAFLTKAAQAGSGLPMACPDAVLFNGGFFTPALARDQVLDALASWFGARPDVFDNATPESAVAIGAAFYGSLRRDPTASKRLIIRAGSARSYYIALGGPAAANDDRQAGARTRHANARDTTAVCVLPRGTEEGTRLEIDRAFTVETNRPANFTLYSSTGRTDALNAIVTVTSDRPAGSERVANSDSVATSDPVASAFRRKEPPAETHNDREPSRMGDSELESWSPEVQHADDFVKHAPLVTALRYGKRSRRVPLAVRLSTTFTETGTLELWCESRTTDHRWRLAFNLRSVEGDLLEDSTGEQTPAGATAEVVVQDEARARGVEMIRGVFGSGRSSLAPESLVGELEMAFGHGKHAWPLAAIRTLADVLLETEPGRRMGAGHEMRWLNLIGFCTRPGFGGALDAWRVSELRKVYAAGLAFPKDVQNQVEWIVLWQRVGAGFTAGQQRELSQRITGQLGLGHRKAARVNPQIERESWRLLASLERLDAVTRERLGEEALDRVRREPRNATWLWAVSRFGARTPLYGPLNGVPAPSTAERWIDRLLAVKDITPDLAAAVAQIGARTGDPARDIADRRAEVAALQLQQAGFADAAERLRVIAPSHGADAGRIFGEALPEGLSLGDRANHDPSSSASHPDVH